jgi:hypothetical protein
MEEGSGVNTFLIGMGVLIAAAVGVSVLVEKRFQFSGTKQDIAAEIIEDDQVLAELRRCLAENHRIWDEVSSRVGSSDARYRDLKTKYESELKKASLLVERKKELNKELPVLVENFTRYQFDYRKKVWGTAIGNKMAVLKTRDGREYSHVEIVNVTQAGLEIRHEFGIARFKPNDLDEEMQNRFQWASASDLLKGN